MSRITPLATRLASVSSAVPRATFPASPFAASRCISSTAARRTGPVDTTKDTLKKADRLVSDAAVKGINKGEQATEKIKNAVGIASEETKAKGEEVKGETAEAAGKSKEMAEEAKGKTEQAFGEAKDKAKKTFD
ncbi:hypothetical protein ASPWEDRAFT_25131 [Aspergillus wentii DTO 134E9]|uniref:LEA domain protein n=1 Tax=Aspergillus wentii DTO 134E9 TaxID=1073089 RepID=A0A1L9RWP7_ASPWE|nr:uncharacterized protein ASPWEDRAFT_25131 [Aspergillus wentii DTO 134E9]KAI9929022.1 hypothetical protein MW887_001417 [Aspergillus wentii]OJJ39287.1 hypothetical protein ASPWEDRAFT_25131 [Aspergillus wentii DTO 134E9]